MAATSKQQLTDMSNVSTLGNTTVMLDQLYESYGHILQQAKKQLEAIDINEKHLESMTQEVVNNNSFVSAVSQDISKKIVRLLEQGDTPIIDKLSDIIIKRVDAALNEHLTELLQKATNDYLNSDSFKTQLFTAIASDTQVLSTRALRASIQALLADQS